MIAGLKEPKTRLRMIEALLKLSGGFGGVQGYSPRTPLEILMAKASQAAHGAFDVPTVEEALADPDWLLRITAVEHFGNPRENTNEWKRSEAETTEWERLLQQMKKLAAGDDESIRSAAVERLRGFPGTESFLAERETNETSANVIMKLISGRYVGEDYQKRFENRFLALFVPLLSNPDEKVREDALIFIAYNHDSAPMYHIAFGMDVFERVIASTKAKSAKERWMAAFALKEVRRLDRDRSLETFLHLVNDPDEDVRSHIAAGLADQLDREDVKQAIAILVQDKLSKVSFSAIAAAGPAKYIPELEALSKCPDPYAAGMAADTLKRTK